MGHDAGPDGADDKERVRQMLRELDTEVLRVVASKVPGYDEKHDRDEMIDRICQEDQTVQDLNRSLRQALQLHVRQAESKVLDQIEARQKTVDDRLMDHDGKFDSVNEKVDREVARAKQDAKEGIDGLKSNLNAALAQVQQDVAGLKADVGWVRNVYGTVGGMIAAFVAISGLLGFKTGCDVTTMQGRLTTKAAELDQIRTQYDANLAFQEALAGPERQELIKRLTQTLDATMADFSKSLPSADLLAEALRGQQALRDVTAAYAAISQTLSTTRPTLTGIAAVQEQRRRDDLAVMAQLGNVFAALEVIARLQAVGTGQNVAQLHDEAVIAWRRVRENGGALTPNAHPELRERIAAWTANALGVLHLRRFRPAPPNELDRAIAEFQAGEAAAYFFPRAYQNHAVAVWAKVEASAAAGNWTAVEQQLVAGRDLLNRALDGDQDPRFSSNLWNNHAFYSLGEATFLARRPGMDAGPALARARSEIEKAVDRSPFHPVAFLTRAEIECFALTLPDGVPADAAQRLALLDRILADLRTCRQNNYFGQDKIKDLNTLLTKAPLLTNMEKLDPQWRPKAAAAAGLIAG